MRKVIWVIVLTIVVIFPLSGQQYHKLLEKDKFWDEWFTPGNNFECPSGYRLSIDEDTIINTLKYFKIRKQNIPAFASFPNCEPYLLDTVSMVYHLPMREDTLSRQVFIWDNGEEHLLYDFSLDVGDTLKSEYLGGGDEDILIVTMKDSVMLFNGEYRNRFFINNCENCWYYIEGIGNWQSLWHPLFGYSSYNIELRCVRKEGVSIWGETCNETYTSVHQIIESPNGPIKVSPNPVTNEININLKNRDFLGSRLTIYDCSGKKHLNDILTGENTILDISKLPNGIYFLKLMRNNQVIGFKKFIKESQ